MKRKLFTGKSTHFDRSMIIDYLTNHPAVKEIHLTGSRHIVPDAAHEDSDWDYLVFAGWFRKNSLITDLRERFEFWGGTFRDLDGYPRRDFESFKWQDINVIVTSSARYYHKWKRASKLAQSLNIVDKDKRCELYDEILYGR